MVSAKFTLRMILLRHKWISRLLIHLLSPTSSLFALYQFLAHGIHPSYQSSCLSLIPGTKTGADIGDGSCEPALASPTSHTNPFPVLHLVEDLRLALEMLEHPQERAALLSQIPGPTAAYIKESLVSGPMACLGNHWET